MTARAKAGVPLAERARRELADCSARILLDDLVVEALQPALEALDEKKFSMDSPSPSAETVATRVAEYEAAIDELLTLTTLIGRWGLECNQRSLIRMLRAIAAVPQPSTGGYLTWLGLRWLPFQELLWTAGIAALAGRQYGTLAVMLSEPGRVANEASAHSLLIGQAATGASNGDQDEAIKRLAGYERRLAPRSEYLYETLQSRVDGLLAVGADYDESFERFEVLHALSFAHALPADRRFWMPTGRFVSKYRHVRERSLLVRLENEATTAGDAWPPVAAGLFAGSHARYLALSKRSREEFLDRLPWY